MILIGTSGFPTSPIPILPLLHLLSLLSFHPYPLILFLLPTILISYTHLFLFISSFLLILDLTSSLPFPPSLPPSFSYIYSPLLPYRTLPLLLSFLLPSLPPSFLSLRILPALFPIPVPSPFTLDILVFVQANSGSCNFS